MKFSLLCVPCSNWWFYVLHCIINGHSSGYTATRWINIHMDRFCAAFRLFTREFLRFIDKETKSELQQINDQCFDLQFTCKNSNWATISELMLSFMPPIKQMIRSLSNREKISYDRSPRPVCSITIGTKPNIFRHVAWICLLKLKFYEKRIHWNGLEIQWLCASMRNIIPLNFYTIVSISWLESWLH